MLLLIPGFALAESDDYPTLLLALVVIGVFAVAYLWLAIAAQRWEEPWSAWALIAPAFGASALVAGADLLVVFIGVGCGGCAFAIAVGARFAARRTASRRAASAP